MRKWAASGLVAAYLLALLVRLSPLTQRPLFGSDAGEYFRIARDLLATGHVSLAYPGWGVTYPWFPGVFFVVDGLAIGGLGIPTALNLAIPALGAFVVVPVFLIVAPRLRDDRAALLSAVIVATSMPHAYPTAHAIPATLGDLLVFATLAMALQARVDRRWLLPIALAVPAVVITHHLSAYFLAVALLVALFLRAMLNPAIARRDLARDAAVSGYALGAALLYWFGYATPWRGLLVTESVVQPWWLLFVALAAGLLVLAGIVALRRRTAARYRPTVPDLRHGVLAYALGLGAILVVVAGATLRPIPGTAITASLGAAVWFLPFFILIAFSGVGRRPMEFARGGVDMSGWLAAFVLSTGFGALVAPRVLIPYRHFEYLVVALALLAGLGFVWMLDLAGPRRIARGIAVSAVALVLVLAAATAIPPPAVLANFDEGITPRAFDAAFWAGVHVPADALVAADHRSSTVLFGFGGVDATWDAARETFLATSFLDARGEMAAVTSVSGRTRVDFVLIDADSIRGLQLFPWEPAYALGGAAVAKFADPPFVKVLDSGYADLYWVNWGLAG